jgi:hypothetical protein
MNSHKKAQKTQKLPLSAPSYVLRILACSICVLLSVNADLVVEYLKSLESIRVTETVK